MDPSSSSPEILVRTLLLLPPRCKFGLFFFYPHDASLDPSSSTPEILVRTLLLLLLLPRDSSSDLSSSSSSSSSPSLIYISMSPTITASISSTIIKLFGLTVTVVREGGDRAVLSLPRLAPENWSPHTRAQTRRGHCHSLCWRTQEWASHPQSLKLHSIFFYYTSYIMPCLLIDD